MADGVAPPNIFGGGYSSLLNGGSLLDAGRRINRSGVGMSARSRALLEGFYNNGSALFNQLYAKAEGAEIQNVVTIKALRSKHSNLIEDNGGIQQSSTNGNNVDTSA